MQQFIEVTEEWFVCLEINPILKSLKYLILLKKKKKKGRFMEITIKGVSCSIYRVICSYFPFSISLHFIHLCHPDTSYSPQEDDGGGTLSI